VNIPTRFKLFGQTINIVYPEHVFREKDGYEGFATYRTNEIQLRPNSTLSQEAKEQTFFHELTHFILYHAGASYSGKTEFMHQDECFVDMVSNLLHQAISTFEYESQH
jgi:predicted SprT family Zn-dependent metalloprotease